MTTITTRLIKDGNSVAVRLPKTVLAMSGFKDDIQMDVKYGQITLRSSPKNRAKWPEKIAKVLATDPNITFDDEELSEWDITSGDGIK